MTHDELLQLIAEVQRHQSELDNVEVKAARQGTPQRLFEPLSAFANQPAGGVILCGLDESRDFAVCGVGDAQRLQEEVSQVAAEQMEPALRPEFTVAEVDGGTVVAVEVPAVARERRPCHYKAAGVQKGSYIRVGNTNRQMTDYEIFGYLSAVTQATFDEEIVADATLDDLEQSKLQEYVAGLRRTRPQASYLSSSFEEVLIQLRIIRNSSGVLRPTLAGLLVFGRYPQAFEPQLVITFVQFYGTTETEKTPRGERFLDNKKFEGALPEMLESVVNYVMASMRKSSLIEGLWRRDIPEYPEEAVREAVANAVAHRDYSQYVRGSYSQIRLFADRLEIQSPGGLYGNVTEETLEEEHSTRNRVLMRLLEDLHLVENRGSGISTMIEAMRRANLAPPRFQDRRSSFWVIFRNHTLMDPEAIGWLNQFSGQALNDRQRLALVYARLNERIANTEYRQLNHVDQVTAYRELRGLVQAGLLEQHSTGRWTYYALNVPTVVALPDRSQGAEEQVIAYVRQHGDITNAGCRALLGLGFDRVSYLLTKMYKQGVLERQGTGRWTRYRLPSGL